MRAGRLRHRVAVLELTSDLSVVERDQRWVEIRAREGDSPAAVGLRQHSRVEVRARFAEHFKPGRYLRRRGRLLHIVSVRDFKGDRTEVVMTCEELIGEGAVHKVAGLPDRPCRVFLQHEAPVFDEMGRVTDYKTRAEVALIEVGRPQVGDHLVAGGVIYQVLDYDDKSDDGVVRGLWLLPVV